MSQACISNEVRLQIGRPSQPSVHPNMPIRQWHKCVYLPEFSCPVSFPPSAEQSFHLAVYVARLTRLHVARDGHMQLLVRAGSWAICELLAYHVATFDQSVP